MNILSKWEITADQLTILLAENPSLCGMLLGYVAELKLKEVIAVCPGVSYITKFDDHNRKKKGDLYIIYRGRAFSVESKSLQTATVIWNKDKNHWIGKAQVDGSDKRNIKMPDGTTLNTTLLLRGEFDVLAINCYAFGEHWRFAFARNSDLPCSTWKKYTQAQRECLISSMIPITWPPEPPFYNDIHLLLDEMITEGQGTDPVCLELER